MLLSEEQNEAKKHGYAKHSKRDANFAVMGKFGTEY